MNIPVCLTIAGSDSSGGAGIQADLKAFAYFTTFGTSAVTAITAQTPAGVSSIYPVPVDEVLLQYRAVTDTMTVNAVKTGMLTNADIVETVCDEFAELRGIPIIVDPVMVAGSGDRLVEEKATELILERLLPLATLITPNVMEAEMILDQPLPDNIALIEAVQQLTEDFDCAVMLKGGHHSDKDSAIDYLATDDATYRLRSPLVNARSSHGTGCTLSAAIAANLASGKDMITAAAAAKAYVHHSLANCSNVGPAAWAMVQPEVNEESIVEVEIL